MPPNIVALTIVATIAISHLLPLGSAEIDITNTPHLIYNNEQINATNLHNFLKKHERILLFGNDVVDANNKNNNNAAADDDDGTTVYNYKLVNVKHKTRSKRSLEKRLNFNISDNHGENLNLMLRKSPKLIDENFAFIVRYENTSNLLDNFHDLQDCFYNSHNSAFDLCDNDKIRGILKLNNNTEFYIQPLPDRFGYGSHILTQIQRQGNNNSSRSRTCSNANADVVNADYEQAGGGGDGDDDFNNDEYYFEPNMKDAKYSKLKSPREHGKLRNKRYIHQPKHNQNVIPNVLHIETAIFVDRDLFHHMAKNFPKNTESYLIRFVLAMINGVQLLYHHPSLGRQINFILKRLEVLHSDPSDLRRSSDIDIYLNSFCSWQRKLNPVSDADIMHFDHAVILTGLDLYVVSKLGKVSAQVVGLAPVAGMCTSTSSCTINEGKHFESVFVVAHEIGHNLGMRHDTSDNSCDPSLFIMSPTLGSGKITWSTCSKDYLETFLKTTQATCLFDRGNFGSNWDHSAEGILPGERFDADQQCILKYGKESVRSKSQNLGDICRDLHCQRDRYTWTSHPALEGTSCGEKMWCKSGVCVLKTAFLESYSLPKQIYDLKSPERSNIVDSKRFGNLKQEIILGKDNKISMWTNWSVASECESGCLYGESGRLKEGSTGLYMYSRTCFDYRPNKKKCLGQDKKYETCTPKQCYSISRTTVLEFANQICDRAKEFDHSITGVGVQQVAENENDSCMVFCETKSGIPKTKKWIFPDGTTCKNKNSDFDDSYYCINGRCEKFSCDINAIFKMDESYCPQSLVFAEKTTNSITHQENGRDYKSVHTTSHENYAYNHTLMIPTMTTTTRAPTTTTTPATTTTTSTTTARTTTTSAATVPTTVRAALVTPKAEFYKSNPRDINWRSKNYDLNPTPSNNYHRDIYQWITKSGCHFSCIDMSKGIQLVTSRIDYSTNIQLCAPEAVACDKIQSTYDYATKLCYKYQQKVRGLSGIGMQISASIEDPDRSCKIACQDNYIKHRFYLVNGEQGFLPFGTKCSNQVNDKRYCVNGKCLKFGDDNTPLNESYNNLALFRRNKRSLRKRRNFLYYNPVNITERLNIEFLESLISHIDFEISLHNDKIIKENIDMQNPIYISLDDYLRLN